MPPKSKTANPQPPQAGPSKRARRRARKSALMMERYGRVDYAPSNKLVRASVRAGAVASRASAAAMRIATAISLPHESPAVRLPTTDLSRTSVGTFVDQLILSTSPGTPSGFNTGDLLVAFYGQPNRLATYFGQLPAGQSSVYTLNFQSYTGSGLNTISSTWYTNVNYGSLAAGAILTINPQDSWPFMGAQYTSGANVDGATLPAGLSNGKRYIWLDLNSVLAFNLTNLPAAISSGTAYFTVSLWGQELANTDNQFTVPLASTSGGANYVAGFPGYYSFTLDSLIITGSTAGGTGAIRTTVTKTNTGPFNFWAHVHMGDLDLNNSGDPSIGKEVRVNACSLLMSNTTANIQKQGSVLAARINETPFQNMTLSVLQRAAEKYTGQAENGVYTFKEFTPEAEKYRECIDSQWPAFDLDYSDFYHFIQISSSNYAVNPNSFTVSFTTTLEFKSDLARHSKGVAAYADYPELIAARGIISASPDWFYENPLHWNQILDAVRRGAKSLYSGLKTYGPSLLTAAGTFAPQYAPMFGAARGLVTHLP